MGSCPHLSDQVRAGPSGRCTHRGGRRRRGAAHLRRDIPLLGSISTKTRRLLLETEALYPVRAAHGRDAGAAWCSTGDTVEEELVHVSDGAYCVAAVVATRATSTPSSSSSTFMTEPHFAVNGAVRRWTALRRPNRSSGHSGGHGYLLGRGGRHQAARIGRRRGGAHRRLPVYPRGMRRLML